jgi:hypothetical protein
VEQQLMVVAGGLAELTEVAVLLPVLELVVMVEHTVVAVGLFLIIVAMKLKEHLVGVLLG